MRLCMFCDTQGLTMSTVLQYQGQRAPATILTITSIVVGKISNGARGNANFQVGESDSASVVELMLCCETTTLCLNGPYLLLDYIYIY